ncbi:MAG: flagellar hook-basal body complex protein FliE [Planctomycetota bacterium]
MNPVGASLNSLRSLTAQSRGNATQSGQGVTDSFLSQLNSLPTPDSPDFGKLTQGLVNQFQGVNAMQNNADAMVHSMITGGDVNEAEVLTAVQKADLAFRMMLQIRNKLMDAYREIQQIQI